MGFVTTNTFVATKVSMSRQNCCDDNIMFVAATNCHSQFLLVLGQEEAPSSLQPPPLPTATAPKSSPQKKMLSMFDDDDEDEGDLFAAAPSKPAAEGKRKDVSAPLCRFASQPWSLSQIYF